MIFNIITLFPEFFKGCFDVSLIKKAQEKGLIKINILNLRDFTPYKHKQCDDKPYGGGAGMVLMLVPIYNAIIHLKKHQPETKIIYPSPQGKIFNFQKAKELAKLNSITILCGHYEAIDNRVIENLIDEEISIGDYILTGGEIAAVVLIDAISRYVKNVVGNEDSVLTDSFENFLLKYPQWTRPKVFKGMKVPEILLSGDHKKIAEWRLKMQIELTKRKRPDLYKIYENLKNKEVGKNGTDNKRN